MKVVGAELVPLLSRKMVVPLAPYVPGSRTMVMPGCASETAFGIVRHGAASVPGLLFDPVGERNLVPGGNAAAGSGLRPRKAMGTTIPRNARAVITAAMAADRNERQYWGEVIRAQSFCRKVRSVGSRKG